MKYLFPLLIFRHEHELREYRGGPPGDGPGAHGHGAHLQQQQQQQQHTQAEGGPGDQKSSSKMPSLSQRVY